MASYLYLSLQPLPRKSLLCLGQWFPLMTWSQEYIISMLSNRVPKGWLLHDTLSQLLTFSIWKVPVCHWKMQSDYPVSKTPASRYLGSKPDTTIGNLILLCHIFLGAAHPDTLNLSLHFQTMVSREIHLEHMMAPTASAVPRHLALALLFYPLATDSFLLVVQPPYSHFSSIFRCHIVQLNY